MNKKQYSLLQEAFFKGEKRVFKKGEILLAANQKQIHTFYIQKGFVAVYAGIKKPKERLLAILPAKTIFPLLQSIINDPKPATFVALDELIVYILPKNEFDKLIKNPEVSYNLLQNVCDLLNTYIDRVDNLEMTTAYTRLISRLLFFARKYGTKKGNLVVINVPITHALIANSIAVTRETVTRELIRLEKKELIQYTNQKIILNDLEALREELHLAIG